MFARISSNFAYIAKATFSRASSVALFTGTSKLFHSKPITVSQPDMKIRLVPALEDNYMYLLVDEETKQCAAVDPVEPEKIIEAVKEENCTLTTILTTHHHWDHANGNDKLVKLVPRQKIVVCGGDERVPALNKKVGHGDQFKVGNLDVKCLFTPCHTTGHICYFVTSPKGEQPAVFTGDTLFVGGCGKFFEGTADMMYSALVTILSKLPGNTRVFCGHEYTVNNLKFALHVEPENQTIKEKFAWAKDQRAKNCPTIPSTIDEELKFNPFMRVEDSHVQKHCGKSDPVSTMGFLRDEKNNFRG
ncbi:hydroxyacylglutathione hydrolase, mitochondrial-like isoform X2 [Saccostrea echinata]|uniref:hydroxyacylglutathione hydrolase, mitochondrial-like isoform X2 n=1 Tax=Saccostrea echinata TaxID=191078 RepID=UPI002A839094|nr:hydroxyacylglutathione hydrolase, mitochondrial-like isoform X2 [Saccostrea echinata]